MAKAQVMTGRTVAEWIALGADERWSDDVFDYIVADHRNLLDRHPVIGRLEQRFVACVSEEVLCLT